MTEPKHERDDTSKVIDTVAEQIRTSLLAVLGAGSVASQAVADAVSKAKDRVAESGDTVRENLKDLPNEAGNFKEKLDPAELRKSVNEYADAAVKLFNKLAETGEQTWEKIAAQPQVKTALDQLSEALQAVQERAGKVADETRERVDDVVSRVSKRTQSAGEQAANTTRATAERVNETVGNAAETAASKTEQAAKNAAEDVKKAKPKANGSSSASSSAQ